MGSFYEPRERTRQKQPGRAVSVDLRAAGTSDPGCERESNEDRFLLVMREDMAGYFVFDGMGGQPAGEAAAQISADVVQRALENCEGGNLKLLMSHVINLAQEALLSRGGDAVTAGMGTTVVGVLVRQDELVVGSVGDSRAYNITRDSVAQITRDHTLVQQLVDAGQLSPDDALVHPQSHILTRCLGSTLDFGVDIKRYRIAATVSNSLPQEWLLLCSDGLYSLVSDEEMAAIVLNFIPEEAAQKLIEIARSRGGFDNVTAVVIPLASRLEEWSEDGHYAQAVRARPAPPESLVADSRIDRGRRECVYQTQVSRVARARALVVVSMFISAVIWFLVFTMK